MSSTPRGPGAHESDGARTVVRFVPLGYGPDFAARCERYAEITGERPVVPGWPLTPAPGSPF
ncbi:hypothetical protein [Streptomyces sp. CA-253872]|uniref:hypothetical protein n=1 Tax=Streptomyces sp. CA-253872 TaxID=3240067 RepID=UPI003D8C447E